MALNGVYLMATSGFDKSGQEIPEIPSQMVDSLMDSTLDAELQKHPLNAESLIEHRQPIPQQKDQQMRQARANDNTNPSPDTQRERIAPGKP